MLRGTDRPTIGTIAFPPFRRVERIPALPNRTTRSGSRCKNAGTDTHTDTLTETQTLGQTFFSDPPEEIFDHNTFNAKALKPLLSTILK